MTDNPYERLAYWKDRPRCNRCGLRITTDPYGGSDCWIHLSIKMNKDHPAEHLSGAQMDELGW